MGRQDLLPTCRLHAVMAWGVCDVLSCVRVQTSDLDTITLSSVVQRLEAESGSAPGAGLQFAEADVKREVDRQLSLSASFVLECLPKPLVECCDVPFHALAGERATASMEAEQNGSGDSAAVIQLFVVVISRGSACTAGKREQRTCVCTICR